MIRVQLLRRFTMYTQDRELILPTAKTRTLAAYLFWQQGRWVSRGFLRGMLWGEVEEKRASANLRQTLYYLRKAFANSGMNQDILETREDLIRILARPDIYIDAHIFEMHALQGLQASNDDIKSLVAASSIYRGYFLDGIDGDWCQIEKKRLSDIYISVLRALVDKLSTSGLYQVALSYAQRWLEADPLDESAHQALMRLYANMGQPSRALQQFEDCRGMLKVELGVNPGEETIRLCREIGLNPDNGAHRNSKEQLTKKPAVRSKSQKARNISKEPLQNASYLLVYGEDQALQGDIATGMKSLKKALSIYDRLGNEEEQARAKLVIGNALLNTPFSPRPDLALEYIEPALTYYRNFNQSANLCQAFRLATEAYMMCGRTDTAYTLAQEGMGLACSLNNKDSEARLAFIAGLVCLSESKIKEAETYIEGIAQTLTCFTDTPTVLNLALYRGFFASLKGDILLADRYLREAIAICKIITSSPRVEQVEFTARTLLMLMLYFQDEREEIMRVCPPPEAWEYAALKDLTHLASLLLPTTDLKTALKDVEAWLRTNSFSIFPHPNYIPGMFRQLIEHNFELGLYRDASRLAAAGARYARSMGWPRVEAVLYSHRSAALAKLGKVDHALVCRRRAVLAKDEGDLWTPAWLAYADGLIAKARGNDVDARLHFTHSIDLFSRMGCKFHVRRVEVELTE